MKHIYIGFACLLFGNIIANIPSDGYLLTAIGLGLVGCIVLAVGIYREYGGGNSTESVSAKETTSDPSPQTDVEDGKDEPQINSNQNA